MTRHDLRKPLIGFTFNAVPFAALAIGLGLQLIPATPIVAQEQPVTARRIRVPLPLKDSSDRVIKQMVQRVLAEQPAGGERPVIVFDFWVPENSDGSGTEFERALSLARFLTGPELERVRTIAFIPKSATGHAVLAALACEEIIMSEDAVLGEAGAGEVTIGPTMRGGYAEIARSRRTVPEAIALGMLDPDLTISRVTTSNGELYAWPEELQRLKRERNDIQEINTFIPAGQMGRFRGDKLRELGIVSYLADDVPELAAALRIPADQFAFDPSMGKGWEAIQVEVNGPVNSMTVDRIVKIIQRELDTRQVNFVCVRINSPGGSPNESVRLAGFLADLEASQLRTVAYIPREARSDAMIIALACDQIVVEAEAILGGDGAVAIRGQEIADLKEPIQRIAERESHTWSLVLAMIDPELEVFRYRRAGSNQTIYLSPEEFREKYGAEGAGSPLEQAEVAPAEESEVGDWIRGEPITTAGKVLELDGKRAEQFGLARFVVNDFNEFAQLYQLEESPEIVEPNWAFDVVDALASPELGGILLFIGAFALMAEISSPGLGLGGFLSILCFMLYFWANYLNGTAEILEVMLFLAGISFVIIEIFVIPGFGVFGLGGGFLVISSLVLASQTFVLPSNSYQYNRFSSSLMMVAMAVFGLIVSGFVLSKYLHRAPILSRMMLLPPDQEARVELARRESLVDYNHLMDEVGLTRTQLTPSGKAVFGSEVMDVISDGQVIQKGEPIRVIEVSGSRIVVEPVELNGSN
ncbi:MAG: NfeD family protein [Pirellulaceae bacterium]|nr:NfeD family protein [Pirellulaceae bacterium]